MPGSGKSTFGRLYSRLTGREFLDFDDYVEQSLDTKIYKVFQEHGEQKFRELETDILRSIKNLQKHVIALGGGTLLSEKNHQFVLENGLLASLVGLPLQNLAERIWKDNAMGVRIRPLFLPCETRDSVHQKLKILHSQREKIYQNAHVILNQNLNSTDNLIFILKFYEQQKFFNC